MRILLERNEVPDLKRLGNVKHKKNIRPLFKTNYLRTYKYFLKHSKVILSDKILFLAIISVANCFETVIVVALLVLSSSSFTEDIDRKVFLKIKYVWLVSCYRLICMSIKLFGSGETYIKVYIFLYLLLT